MLIGHGDTTLSRLPAGQESVYAGAPKLQTLAEATVAAVRGEVSGGAHHPGGAGCQLLELRRHVGAELARRPAHAGLPGSERPHCRSTATATTRAPSPARAPPIPIGRAGAAFLDALCRPPTRAAVVDSGVSTALGTAVGQTVLAEVQSQTDPHAAAADAAAERQHARRDARPHRLEGDRFGWLGRLPAGGHHGPALPLGRAGDGRRHQGRLGLSPNNAVPASAHHASCSARCTRASTTSTSCATGYSVAGKTGSLSGRFTGDNAVARGPRLREDRHDHRRVHASPATSTRPTARRSSSRSTRSGDGHRRQRPSRARHRRHRGVPLRRQPLQQLTEAT